MFAWFYTHKPSMPSSFLMNTAAWELPRLTVSARLRSWQVTSTFSARLRCCCYPDHGRNVVGLTRIRILLYYIHNTHTYILYIIAREKKREREREKKLG